MRVLRHGEVDSTNERALAALAEGTARHGDVHVARAQTAGRGRRGRRWHSPADEGLYLTLVLLPPPPPPPAAAWTVAAGLAVREALEALGVPDPSLKWPNDVLVGGAKLAGVLVETRGLDPARPHFAVGVGVDVAQRVFPAEIERERAVTSLARLGLARGVDEVLEGLLPALEARLVAPGAPGDLDGLGRDYLAAARLAGRHVRVATAQREVEGRLVGLSLAGGELELALGERRERLPLAHVVAVTAL